MTFYLLGYNNINSICDKYTINGMKKGNDGMNEKKKMYYGWWIVFVGFLIYALIYSSISTAGVFTLPICDEFGFGRSAYSVRSLFAATGTIIGSFTMGQYIAKHDIKRTMLGSCVLLIISVVGFAFCTQLWQFYALSLLQGFGFAGASMITVPVLINTWFGPKKKGLAMSIALAGSGVGGMILTVILNWFCQNQGWRAAYYINALSYVIVIPFIALFIVKSPKEKGLQRLGEEADVKGAENSYGIPFEEGKKTGAYWLILGSFFLMSVVNSGILNHEIAYFNDAGFTAAKAASLGALAVGSLTVGKLILGTMCDKAGVKRSVFLGNVMLFAAMVFLYMCAGVHGVSYVYVIFYAVGGSVATVAVPLVVASVFGDKEFSRYLGNINVATGIGNPIGAILCGALFDVSGSYGPAWIVFAVMAAVIVIMQVQVFKGKKQGAAEAFANERIEGVVK